MHVLYLWWVKVVGRSWCISSSWRNKSLSEVYWCEILFIRNEYTAAGTLFIERINKQTQFLKHWNVERSSTQNSSVYSKRCIKFFFLWQGVYKDGTFPCTHPHRPNPSGHPEIHSSQSTSGPRWRLYPDRQGYNISTPLYTMLMFKPIRFECNFRPKLYIIMMVSSSHFICCSTDLSCI